MTEMNLKTIAKDPLGQLCLRNWNLNVSIISIFKDRKSQENVYYKYMSKH